MSGTIYRVLDIVRGTAVDGPGLRTSIYLAGCAHCCPGCHNPESWDFNGGREMELDDIMAVVREEGWNVTLTGGDPMYTPEATAVLVERLRDEGYGVWLYTGFTLEELLATGDEDVMRILRGIEMLVDGPFVTDLRDTSLRFRGSSNQRLLPMPASLAGRERGGEQYGSGEG